MNFNVAAGYNRGHFFILEGLLCDNTFYFIERFSKSAYAKELAAKIIK